MIFYFRENIIHTTPDNKRDIRLHPLWLCAIRYIGTPRNNDYVIIPILLSILLYHYTYYIMLKRRSTSLPTSFPADPLTSVIRNNYYYYNERECYTYIIFIIFIHKDGRVGIHVVPSSHRIDIMQTSVLFRYQRPKHTPRVPTVVCAITEAN